MAKAKTEFVCGSCGHSSPKWAGRCTACGGWNTFEEQAVRSAPPAPSLSARTEPIALADVPRDGGGEVRVRTGVGELDNVLGGGLVAGSLVLLGGDPGVGKSTLLLAALDRFSRRGIPVLYVTGEESVRQVHLRAERLGVDGRSLFLLADTDVDRIEQVARERRPMVMVVDSVQTVQATDTPGIPGSVSQVREVAHRAMVLAKQTGIAVVLVGHVTKSGDLAGPKVLEHLVDTVLYFEGDGRSSLRVLRAVKNRFGPAGELGMFEMTDGGLVEVPDASARLLQERVPEAPGTAVVVTMQGQRPLLAEVQVLVGNQVPYTPARTCVGVDRNRVLMLAAVMEKAGFQLRDRDLFVNAAGGLDLTEPAADLAICAAIASSYTDRPVRDGTVLVGEVGLVGEVRAVAHPAPRLREVVRHGFRRVVAPGAWATEEERSIEVIGARTVGDALSALGLEVRRPGRS